MKSETTPAMEFASPVWRQWNQQSISPSKSSEWLIFKLPFCSLVTVQVITIQTCSCLCCVSSKCFFSRELKYSFGPPIVPEAASPTPKYLHLFVISWTQPQHCSVGSAAGNTLLRNPELPCHSFSNFGTGILANTKTILVIPVLLWQNLAKGERRRGPGTMCLPAPWRTGLCCLLVQNNQCPCYPHGFYLMFEDLLVRNNAQQKKGTDYAINIVSYLTCKSPKISQHHTTYTTY